MSLAESGKVVVINPVETVEKVQQSNQEAGQLAIDWPELKPLKNDLLPVKPITHDMVPDEISGWLLDIVQRMDNTGPFEYASVAAIIVSAGLIGRKVSVRPKKADDWTIIPNLWGCCVGKPGNKKSPVLSKIFKPLTRLEAKARDQTKKDIKEAEVQEKISCMVNGDAVKKAEKLVKKGQIKEAEALLMDDSSDQEKPSARRYIVHDATVPMVQILLSKNPQGLIQFNDELSGWIAMLHRDDKQQDKAFYLECHNGDGTFSCDRIGREEVVIPSATLSVLGGIQPGKLLNFLKSQHKGMGDDGFIERFQLLVYPDQSEFRHTDRKPDKALQEMAYQVFQKLDEIKYEPEEEDRPSLRFDTEGQAVFNQWYCALMIRIRGNNISLQMESHLGKYPSLMPSLALLFHIIQHGATGSIGKESAEMAVRWCDVLETHANRVYSLVNDPLAGARILAEKLTDLPRIFKMVDLERKRWAGLMEHQERVQALHWLIIHGYVVPEKSKGNGRPSVTYHIHPDCVSEKK